MFVSFDNYSWVIQREVKYGGGHIATLSCRQEIIPEVELGYEIYI
jgi:hypothetical protein